MTKQVKAIIISIVLIIIGVLTAGGIYHRAVIKKWFKETFLTKQTVDNLKNENSKKDEQLKEQADALENYKSSVSNLTKQLGDAKSEMTRLSSSLRETEAKLNEAEEETTVVVAQKTALLNAVSEIDNKLNNTTEATEIEELDAKKALILSQIDTLNSKISVLTEEKLQLQEDIDNLKVEKATLQTEIETLKVQKKDLETEIEILQEKLRLAEETAGVSFKYSYFGASNLRIHEANFTAQDWTYDFEYISNLIGFINCNNSLHFFCYNNVDIAYNNTTMNISLIVSEFDVNPNYLHNGNSISVDEALNLLNAALANNKELFNVKILLTCTDGVYNISIDLIDNVFTGKYIDNEGRSIDFDNNELVGFGVSTSELVIDSHEEGIYSLGSSGYNIGVLVILDENSFSLDGVTFYKQESQSLGIGSFDLTTALSGSGTVLNNSGTNFNYFQLNFSEIELDTNARYLFELLDSAGDVLYTCQSVLTDVSTETVQGYSIDAVNGDKNEGLNFAITYKCQMDADNNPVASDNSYIYFIITEGYEEAYKNVATLRITEISQSE